MKMKWECIGLGLKLNLAVAASLLCIDNFGAAFASPFALEATSMKEISCRSHLIRDENKKSFIQEKMDLPKMVSKASSLFARIVSKELRYPSVNEIADRLGWDAEQLSELEAVLGLSTILIEEARENHPQIFLRLRERIIKAFTRLAKKVERPPTLREIADLLGTNEKFVESLIGDKGLFQSLRKLQDEAIEKDRRSLGSGFRYFTDTLFFNDEYLEKQLRAIREKSAIILTSVQAGVPLIEDAFQALLQMKKAKDAAVFILPMNMQTVGLDPRLFEIPDVFILTQSLLASPEFEIVLAKIPAKTSNPLSGQGLGGKEQGRTRIFGHGRGLSLSLPTIDNSIEPISQMTTGAISSPDYSGLKYHSDRSSLLAEENHWTGVILAEKSFGTDNILSLPTHGFFHFRHIEFVENSGFLDINRLYSPQGVKTKLGIEALVVGDIHVGESDTYAVLGLKNLILETKPKYLVLHDLFNGHSISHYDREKVVTLARKQAEGHLNLNQELLGVKVFLECLLQLDPTGRMKIIVTPANHNFWLSQYLNSSHWLREPQNSILASELFGLAVRGIDPLESVLLRGTEHGFRKPIEKSLSDRIVFLSPGQSFRVPEGVPKFKQVELGKHGHERFNGGRGGLKSFSRAISSGRIVFGHTHVRQRSNGAVNIGTLSRLDLDYALDGVSSWSHAVGLVGPDGQIQDLQFKGGEFHTSSESYSSVSKQSRMYQFFVPGYPKILSRKPVASKIPGY
ncbi:MAG: hypothetical protein KDD35_03235 [Bdellovibrionales bacterium]|nr:hypothetical protein [Bdellovibrionales bacterium]